MKIYLRNFLVTVVVLMFVPSMSSAQSCGDSITRDITLKGDLDCSSAPFAFEVFANDVTIDLNGFTLSGTNTLVGISVSDFDRLTVKNGVVRGFSLAIRATLSDNCLLYTSPSPRDKRQSRMPSSA